MKRRNYMKMLNDLIGDELYLKFLIEISKEYEGTNLVKFGEEIVNKCCENILNLAKRNKKVDLCFGEQIATIEIK